MEIYFDFKTFFFESTVESLFDLLHEVGHIKTHKRGMRKFEDEYYATEWAIKEIKKFDCMISEKRKDEFQRYIWQCVDIANHHHAKNVPPKEELIFKW